MEQGFNAMGHQVPENRLHNGYEVVKEMMPEADVETRFSIVFKCARFIKNDEPARILAPPLTSDEDLVKLDLTGRYRLLATLLTD